MKSKKKNSSKFHEPWEQSYNQKPANTHNQQVMGSAFNPTPAKDRFKMYVPINETDY